MGGASPIGRDVAQDQPDEFCRCLVGREVAAGLDDFAQLRIDVFDGVHNRHDID